MDKAKQALSEVVQARAKDLESRENVYRTWNTKAIEANKALDSAGKEVTRAKYDLHTVCISYLALIEAMELPSDHPCGQYVSEYKRMIAKGSQVDRT